MSTLESVRWNELHQNPSKNQKKVDMILNDQHKIREQSNAMTILNAFCSLRRCAKEPFVDFATTRNRVLQIAGQRAEYQGWRVHLQLLPPMLMKLNIFEFDGLFCILSFWTVSSICVHSSQKLFSQLLKFPWHKVYIDAQWRWNASPGPSSTTFHHPACWLLWRFRGPPELQCLRIWGGPKQELYHDVKGIHIFPQQRASFWILDLILTVLLIRSGRILLQNSIATLRM